MVHARRAHGLAADSPEWPGPPSPAWARALAAIYSTVMTRNNIRGRARQPETGDGHGLQAWRSTRPADAGQQDALPWPDRPAEGGVRRPWVLAAAGAAATAVPAGSGLACAAAGHPQAVPLLICSGVIGLVSIITAAAVRIYESTQRTRRLQIQHAGPAAIAAAMARCIDDAHAAALDVPAGAHAAEAASVRASAMQAVTEMMPAMLAAIGQQTPRQAGLDAPAPGQRPAQP